MNNKELLYSEWIETISNTILFETSIEHLKKHLNEYYRDKEWIYSLINLMNIISSQQTVKDSKDINIMLYRLYRKSLKHNISNEKNIRERYEDLK